MSNLIAPLGFGKWNHMEDIFMHMNITIQKNLVSTILEYLISLMLSTLR